MEAGDFEAVLNVHLSGAMHCSKAVWELMREQQYGRIVMTISAAGLYGNFGQANYAAAKMALIGFMNVLHLEGMKHNIRVNAITPIAATRMTEGLLPPAALAAIQPERVTPGVLFLCSEHALSRIVLSAGGGSFAAATVMEAPPCHFEDAELSPEGIAARFDEIADSSRARAYANSNEEVQRFLETALGAAR